MSKGAGDFTPAATRPWRDTAWLYWFLLNTAVVLLWGGILSTQAGPPVDLKLQSSCAAGSGRRLLANGGARRELEGAAATLCIFACVCAVPVALGFLYLLRNEGLFVGSSSAMNCVGAVKVARLLPPGSVIATVLCDGGGRHLSKFHSAEYLAKAGLTPAAQGAGLGFVEE